MVFSGYGIIRKLSWLQLKNRVSKILMNEPGTIRIESKILQMNDKKTILKLSIQALGKKKTCIKRYKNTTQ